MSLKAIAQETLEIIDRGNFINSSGETIDFLEAQRKAEERTKLYTPQQLDLLLPKTETNNNKPPIIEVTNETTQVAAHRLVKQENCEDLVLLNFASARNPGGGFINGAKAQEEDLSRCSGLYPCLLKQPTYYQINRNQKSLLYTDRIIYSPQVPWFRIRSRELLDYIFLASIITAPAPNAGQFLNRNPQALNEIEITLRRRAGFVLTVAKDNKHRNLVLGAWGCGVFRNDPNMVADAFGQWLDNSYFDGCFDRLVFAIYDPTKDCHIIKAFQNRFSSKI